VEEVRQAGKMPRCINATFIALIPKLDYVNSFDDFRLIALCNCLYKIMANIITVQLKPILSYVIHLEKFGFLKGQKACTLSKFQRI
jgi:hypothetical protein